MPTLLEEIQLALDGELPADFSWEPEEEVRSTDHVVGQVPENLKKLYALVIRLRDEGFASLREITEDHFGDPEMINRLECELKRLERLRRKVNSLLEVFWISLIDTFDDLHGQSIGIRRGWQVVWSEGSEFDIDDIIAFVFRP